MKTHSHVGSPLRFAARKAGSILGCLILSLSTIAQVAWAEGQIPPPNDRLHTRTEGDVRVTTAVPSAEEARRIFEARTYRNNVQPVWIQIENLGDVPIWFLPAGVDSGYYTPLETAARSFSWEVLRRRDVDEDFRARTMGIVVEAGEIRSGYIFSRVDEGTKSFNVDLFPLGGSPGRMTFFVPVPGLQLDHYEIEFDKLYASDDIVDVDLPALVEALGSLPCCVTDRKGKDYGDPLNIAFVADVADLYYAFLRAGWDETETIHRGSLLKTGWSALTGGEYRYSPVSSLYVFGRDQDVALQRARGSIHERNHLRLWLTAMRHEGKPVWIGQISRDIGVRLTTKTITTHKIDPAVDETREFLIEDLAYTQSLDKFGYVSGVGAAPYGQPRGNLTGDPYFTDGLRALMWISRAPVSVDEVELLDLGYHPGYPDLEKLRD
jgi:hypothetical protein